MANKQKDWWTLKRKRRLLKFAKTLTLKQISKKMHKTIEEIESMLIKLQPGEPRIRDRYRERGVIITVYTKAWAYGSQDQHAVRATYHPDSPDLQAY